MEVTFGRWQRKPRRLLTPPFVEKMAKHCLEPDEELHRILYYDCPLYTGHQRLPISGKMHEFKGSDHFLHDLSQRDLFAIRRGVLKFRGWDPKTIPVGQVPTDNDFAPRFEQKGVDMRIGLDIATISSNKVVERILLVTGDTDFVPALKHARVSGLQVVMLELPGGNLPTELVTHADFKRSRTWV